MCTISPLHNFCFRWISTNATTMSRVPWRRTCDQTQMFTLSWSWSVSRGGNARGEHSSRGTWWSSSHSTSTRPPGLPIFNFPLYIYLSLLLLSLKTMRTIIFVYLSQRGSSSFFKYGCYAITHSLTRTSSGRARKTQSPIIMIIMTRRCPGTRLATWQWL